MVATLTRSTAGETSHTQERLAVESLNNYFQALPHPSLEVDSTRALVASRFASPTLTRVPLDARYSCRYELPTRAVVASTDACLIDKFTGGFSPRRGSALILAAAAMLTLGTSGLPESRSPYVYAGGATESLGEVYAIEAFELLGTLTEHSVPDTLPDDPDHPHPWGRPFRVAPEEAIHAQKMIAAEPEDWFAAILERHRG